MHLLTVITTLALAVASAHSMFVPMMQGDEQAVAELNKQLEYYGLVPRHNPRHSPHSLAMRILHEEIMAAEANANNIPEKAKAEGLTTLVDLVGKANLTSVLESKGPLTLFGPTNEAITNLPEWAKKAVSVNPEYLRLVLAFHVIPKDVYANQLRNGLIVETAANRSLRVNIYGDEIYTVQCAPIDLKKVNIKADNGLIHFLNKVMIPPAGNAVQALTECPAFTVLAMLVRRANLAVTLAGPGPFTVFAPTDKAFGKLPPGTLERLLADGKELKKVLLYHVVASTACSAGLKSGPVSTLNGESVQVKVADGAVTVNNATVIVPDGSITNGVVHAIDTVLLPKNFVF